MNAAHKANKQIARYERLRRRAAHLGNIRDDKRSAQDSERLGRVKTRLKQLQPA